MGGCECASAVCAEMKDWIRLGGANSGCCGNAAHTYGFHLPAYLLPASDYSRRYEHARPVNMEWACAGDFSHHNNPTLRKRHALVLARLMRGELPMICEFIGKPWPDRPVYYWARWNGIKALQRYTGSGHDHWSHISWWRSRADQRAYLFIAKAAPPKKPIPPKKPVAPPKKPLPKPKPAPIWPPYPGHVLRPNPNRADASVKVWQTQMRARGWRITADGVFGPATAAVVLAFQREKKLAPSDGTIGPRTWRAAWSSPVTH